MKDEMIHQVTHYENALNIAAPAFLNKTEDCYEWVIKMLLDMIKQLDAKEI